MLQQGHKLTSSHFVMLVDLRELEDLVLCNETNEERIFFDLLSTNKAISGEVDG